MKRSIVTFTLFLAASCLACASTQKNAGPAETVEVEVDRMFPVAESLDASGIEVTLAISNPTDSALEVQAIDYSADTKDVAGVLEARVQSSGSVEAQQRAEIKFKLAVPFPEALEAYQAVLKRQSIPVELKGHVHLADGREIPFARSGEVATPSLPRTEVSDPQAARYGKDGVDLTVYLRVINDNVFPILLQNVQYSVFIDDKQVRSETASMGQRVIASSAQEYEITKTVTPKTQEFSADEVKAILKRGSLSYKIQGEITMSRLVVPFEHTGTIQLASGE